MKSDHDSFLAYYLTQDDESALKFKQTRFGLLPYEVPEDQEVRISAPNLFTSYHLTASQETIFHFVRDYETVKVEQEVPNEFLLVLHNGDPPEDLDVLTNGVDQKPRRRERGAYYKNIERKMTLKKKRANVRLISVS